MSSLHSTMICFDNSDFMRNEDYLPSRLQSQIETVQMICRSKIRSHPQNEVGLMTIANNVEVLSTLTNNVGTILTKMSTINPKGSLNLLTGLKIAHLVLKNRQQKDHRTRIVAFVGSPIKDKDETLTQLAKKFKKEKVHADVILMGDYQDNEKKLSAFINALNGSEVSEDNESHLIVVNPGADISTSLQMTSLLAGENIGAMRSPEFLDDEDADLALALRLSLEEQRAAEAEQRRQQQNATNNNEETTAAANTPPNVERGTPNFETMTEEEMIAFALNLSVEEAKNASNPPPPPEEKKPTKDSKDKTKKK